MANVRTRDRGERVRFCEITRTPGKTVPKVKKNIFGKEKVSDMKDGYVARKSSG